jgi:hypothetical protein
LSSFLLPFHSLHSYEAYFIFNLLLSSRPVFSSLIRLEPHTIQQAGGGAQAPGASGGHHTQLQTVGHRAEPHRCLLGHRQHSGLFLNAALYHFYVYMNITIL